MALNELRATMGDRLAESIQRTLSTTSISAVEAADERGASRAATRVSATDMLADGHVSAGEKLYFRDTHKTVHEHVPLTLVPGAGARVGFSVRIDQFGDTMSLQVRGQGNTIWIEEKLPATLQCKGASAALHKQLDIYNDDDVVKAYSKFGENDFVLASDTNRSLADVRKEFKKGRQ